jgi:hypothetical protein
MLDREGVDEPTDLGVIGSRDEVTARIAELATAGVTDFGACEIGGTSEDRLATRDLLRTLAKAANL